MGTFNKRLPFPFYVQSVAAPLPPGDNGGGADTPPPNPTQSVVPPLVPIFAQPYNDIDVRPDYALAGRALWSAAAPDNPAVRRMAPFRKEQIDSTAEPGEQSLETWWLRSQSSFHGGTAQANFDGGDTSNDQIRTIRFLRSVGVNVFKPGKVTLLRDTNLVANTTSSLVRAAMSGGTPVILYTNGVTLSRLADGGSPATLTWGGTATIRALATDGVNYYVADNTGIYKGPVDGSASGTKIWNNTSTAIVLAWIKQRLMAGIDNKVYQLDAAGTGGPVLPSPQFTHPVASWLWTGFGVGPSALYASGYVGSSSSIFKFVLDTQGSVPTLSVGIPQDLPAGEIVYAMLGYLGSVIALGTNRGVRVCRFSGFQANGTDIIFGPLSVKTDNPVYCLSAQNTFIYAGAHDIDSASSGLWKIDLTTEIGGQSSGLYASATDLRANAYNATSGADDFRIGKVSGLDVLDGRMIFSVDNHGVFLEDTTRLVSAGYLSTSRIRFRSNDAKLFKRVRMIGVGKGAVIARLSVDGGQEFQVGALLPASSPAIEANVSAGVRGIVAIASFTLVRDATDHATSPGFEGYTIKALPAQPRQRIYQIPVRIIDSPADPSGQEFGAPGYAIETLEFLEALNTNGDEVLLQFLGGSPAERRSVLVVVDDMEYHQITPPTATAGYAGVAVLTLRSL